MILAIWGVFAIAETFFFLLKLEMKTFVSVINDRRWFYWAIL